MEKEDLKNYTDNKQKELNDIYLIDNKDNDLKNIGNQINKLKKKLLFEHSHIKTLLSKIKSLSKEKEENSSLLNTYKLLKSDKKSSNIFMVLIFITMVGIYFLLSLAYDKFHLTLGLLKSLGFTSGLAMAFCTYAVIRNGKPLKEFKMKNFNNKKIGYEEMKEKTEEKDKELTKQLDTLNKNLENLKESKEYTMNSIKFLNEKEKKLQIDKLLLMKNNLDDKKENDYLKEYLDESIKKVYADTDFNYTRKYKVKRK